MNEAGVHHISHGPLALPTPAHRPGVSCPESASSGEKNLTPCPETANVSPGEIIPIQTQGSCSGFDQKLKTRCSFVVMLLAHLQDLPGAGNGVAPGAAPRSCTLLGCGEREVPPERSTQAAAADGEDLLEGPGWLGFGLAS